MEDKGFVDPIHGVWSLIGLFAGLATRIFLPQIPSGALFCPSRELLGLRCPACGTATAFAALAELRFIHAIIANPLLIIGGIAISAWGLAAFLGHCLGRPLRKWATTPKRKAIQRYSLIAAIALGWCYQLFLRG